MRNFTTAFVVMLFYALPVICFAQIRVVCVGNSVTAGYGLADANTQSWPAQLGALLGNKYVVYNCGVSGTTMLKRGSSPYWNTSRFNDAKNYNPDVLIISLGTNDAHPGNWQYKNDFYNDYVSMIDAFRQNGRNPTIFIVYPVACYGDASQISNLQNELIPLVSQVSKAKGVNLIDFNSPTQNSRNTLYNDNLHPNAAGAALIGRTAFNTITPSVPTFFQYCNQSGYGIKLGIGDYNFAALNARGIFNDDISSVRVPVGYKVFGYVDDNFTGNYVTLTSDNNCLGGWDNLITSIRVRANGVTGRNGTYSLQNRNSGKYMDVAGGNSADGANILQWNGNGQTNQQFTFTDVGDGAYRIVNVATGKAVDIAGVSNLNLGNVLQWTYGGGSNQHFILIASDNGYYKLKAAHSGRVVEVSGGGLNAGDDIIQYDDNNQLHGQWRLNAPGSLRAATESQQKIVEAFPNPASDDITLTTLPENTVIEVLDLRGNVLKRVLGTGDVKVKIKDLPAGTYLIRTTNASSEIRKIIKQ